MKEVAIVICHRSGAERMLVHCLDAIKKHTDADHEIYVVTRDAAYEDLLPFLSTPEFPAHCFIRINTKGGSGVHGRMLDAVIPRMTRQPYVLTLDSDCFPIADGWMSDLLAMMRDEDVGCAGILHPWGPPPPSMGKHLTEYRVRSQHCWDTTHVACQLVRTHGWLEGMQYSKGDDTGLAIPAILKAKGKRCVGFKPTRCPKSNTSLDPEYNRYVGVVYGDKVYHHGGYTRIVGDGDIPVFKESFGWALDSVDENGEDAAWLHDEELCHRFVFDREEEIASEKMQRLFGLHSQRMSG